MDISAPKVAPEEIIRQFAAKESEFQQALNHYTYRRIARVQTIDDDNKVDGEVLRGGRCNLRPHRQPHGEEWSSRRKTPFSGS